MKNVYVRSDASEYITIVIWERQPSTLAGCSESVFPRRGREFNCIEFSKQLTPA